MKTSKVKRRLSLFAVVICISFGILIGYKNLFVKTILVETDQRICLSVPTHTGDTFSLKFIHSVHKTPVWENFTIAEAGQLVLTSTEFQSYGVGMPSLTSEGTFVLEQDRFLLKNLDRKFDQIPIRVGPEARLTLIHNGKEYPLYEMVASGSLLFVRIGIKLSDLFLLQSEV